MPSLQFVRLLIPSRLRVNVPRIECRNVARPESQRKSVWCEDSLFKFPFIHMNQCHAGRSWCTHNSLLRGEEIRCPLGHGWQALYLPIPSYFANSTPIQALLPRSFAPNLSSSAMSSQDTKKSPTKSCPYYDDMIPTCVLPVVMKAT